MQSVVFSSALPSTSTLQIRQSTGFQTRPSDHWRPLLRGSLIAKYIVRWNHDSWIEYGPWLAAQRDPELFKVYDKVCVRQTGDSIIAARVKGDFIVRNNLHFLLARNAEHDLEGLDCMLNSKLTDFLYLFLNPERGEVLAEVKKIHVESLVLPKCWFIKHEERKRLAHLAEASAAAAKRGDEESLAVHEAEIDQIVYRLFDLTPEEITLIESSLAPTREKKPTKRSKAARAVPSAESDDTESPTVAPKAQNMPKPPHTVSAPPSTAKPFLPGELFAMEGELTPAKKAPAAREAASTAGRIARAPVAQSIPIDQTERNDVLATIREVFSSGGARDRDTALKDLATALGYERLGPRIREVLDNDLRTAVGRDILQNQNGELSLLTRQIGDYDRATLKKLFLAAISTEGRVWQSCDDAIRLFTRHLGFRRTGPTLDETARSLINGLLRDGSLEKNGPDEIRRV